MVDLLWMSEDELRARCNELYAALACSRYLLAVQKQMMGEAYALGYGDGATEATLRIACAIENRAETFAQLH